MAQLSTKKKMPRNTETNDMILIILGLKSDHTCAGTNFKNKPNVISSEMFEKVSEFEAKN